VSRALVVVLVFVLSRLPLGLVQSIGRALLGRRRRALRAALADPAGAQRERLLEIVREAQDTVYGKEHDFASIRSIDDFRARVPIGGWDDFAPYVDRMLAGEERVLTPEEVFFYGTSSGTTGRRKLIPITSAFVREFRTGSVLLGLTTLEKMPGAIRGKALMMHSPGLEELKPGVSAGSITAALRGDQSEQNPLDATPPEVFRVKDFDTRYFLCLRFALLEKLTLVTAVNPSTVLLYAQTFERHTGDLIDAWERGALGPDSMILDDELRAALEPKARAAPELAAKLKRKRDAGERLTIRDALPDLVGLCCWQGGNAPWYLPSLRDHYGQVPILDYGYAATEGFFGAPLDVNTAESVLVPHGHFLELMPEDDVEACRAGDKPTVLVHEAEVGQRYYIVATTGAGLYRYDMNDVVEVMGMEGAAPRVVFRHKGGTMSSVTGEKLGESHVARAMKDATPPELEGFVVAPTFPEGDAPPSYVLGLDLAHAHDELDLEDLAERFDKELRAHNEEYDAKRGSLRLGPVTAVRLPPRATVKMRAARVADGAPDAHVKVPHVSPDGSLLLKLGLDEVAPELAARLPCNKTS
jgi:hypothetical protein